MAKSIPIVSIIGRPNVGKSTLFNRFIGRRDAIVDSTAGVTRDRKYGNVSWSGHEFILVDTGGYDAKSDEPILSSVRKQALAAVDESELVLFVVDSETGITAGDEEIAKVILRQSKKVILVVNKVDDKTREPDIYDFMKLGLGEPFPISAESGRRTGDLLEEAVSHFSSSSANSIEEDEGIKIAIVGVPNV
ncbi:MAG: 50S ribosome-binding GTPase, partial [Candidatus Marinimicrobia bacterium]|nr:50S ribosome-binding GTPase [Candidatus Neomarinimicrobiota bacterium]